MNHNKSKAQNPKSKTKNNQFQFFYFISDKNFLCVWNIDILIIVFCSHKNNLKGVHELTMLLPSVVASLWSARSVVICKFQFRNLDNMQINKNKRSGNQNTIKSIKYTSMPGQNTSTVLFICTSF